MDSPAYCCPHRYASEDGTPITSGEFDSAALVTVEGDDGSEEMYAFFPIAWFDTGSWAWAHYFNEWATKGIFMVRACVHCILVAVVAVETRSPLCMVVTR